MKLGLEGQIAPQPCEVLGGILRALLLGLTNVREKPVTH